MLEKQLIVKYDVITGELTVNASDFTTFEALGILEGAKALITHDWVNEEK